MTITQNDIDLLEQSLVTKDDLKNEMTSLKSDLLDKMDDILQEVKTSREEETVMSGQISDHEDRITRLETVSKAN